MDLLAWIDTRPRTYDETLEAWKTSCPRLSVWDDAVIEGLVRIDRRAENGAIVVLTAPRRTAGGGHVTLANPFGPPARGWNDVSATLDRAAEKYRDGEVVGFENVSTVVTGDLAYTLEIESYRARVGGAQDATPVSLRVTSVFRREDGDWKLLHRHADPITTPRPAKSVIESP
jgi:ketosteroid isomerase-like protein